MLDDVFFKHNPVEYELSDSVIAVEPFDIEWDDGEVIIDPTFRLRSNPTQPPAPNLDVPVPHIYPNIENVKPYAVIEKPTLDLGGDHFVTEPPRPISTINYPPECVKLKVQGDVIVEFDISKAGIVMNPRILSSPHQCFNKNLLRQVKSWRYSESEKVRMNVRARVEFII